MGQGTQQIGKRPGTPNPKPNMRMGDFDFRAPMERRPVDEELWGGGDGVSWYMNGLFWYIIGDTLVGLGAAYAYAAFSLLEHKDARRT